VCAGVSIGHVAIQPSSYAADVGVDVIIILMLLLTLTLKLILTLKLTLAHVHLTRARILTSYSCLHLHYDS